ncbi:YheC/YheD family protein [Bacillus sp. FJAT-49732]|uniref:YheC/YheD family protein n=1 Tax=Lederbergia citrisecunda TaxID=2833583 RepID=A0A942YK04_9BACI|nr:YheC/YheD family protein [Lederbergia citrisecunda]MBS4199893.1 YheC/YheD family protein [Lederbergia citrisecunda]
MNVSRGRFGQYKILNSEKSLRKHLLETDLLSEKSLYEFLKKYKSVEIRPSFGPGEITILNEENTFTLHSQSNFLKESTKDEIYQDLKSFTINQKHFIIRPKKLPSRFFQSPFQYYVTVNRESVDSDWNYISKTEKYSSVFGRFFYMYFLRKIEQLSLLTAKKLGESFPDCNTMVIEILYDLKGGIWIRDVIFHYSISKWNQKNTLSKVDTLVPLIPKTDLLTKVTFYDYIKKYNQVILKPTNGQEGKGIVKLTAIDDVTTEIHTGRKKIIKTSMEETYNYLQSHFFNKKYYLIQETLQLATINDCPFDVRVIVQKNHASWKVSGIVVKVASKEFFITNVAEKVLTLDEAMSVSSISHLNTHFLESQMSDICISSARQLNKDNKNIKIIGFDIGLTNQGDIRIIEANFAPDLAMFYRLEDKTMYQNIYKSKKNEIRS